MTDTTEVEYIFAYGSLIWRPDFKFEKKHRASVPGYERRFWQASHDHRGTPAMPGRVVTLVPVPGGRCEGLVYALPDRQRSSILQALDRREQDGYQRIRVEAVDMENGDTFSALTWLASADNPSWVGDMPDEEIASIIATRGGPSGSNQEYLMNLHKAFKCLGIVDDHVNDLALRVSKLQSL